METRMPRGISINPFEKQRFDRAVVVCLLQGLAFVATACAGPSGSPESTVQSRNETPVPRGEYPAVVRISASGPRMETSRSWNGGNCTGTVVCGQLILTAAHCFSGLKEARHIQVDPANSSASKSLVMLASSRDDAMREGTTWHLPPGARDSAGVLKAEKDIALLQTDKPIPGIAAADTEAFRLGDQKLPPGKDVFSVGYGRNAGKGKGLWESLGSIFSGERSRKQPKEVRGLTRADMVTSGYGSPAALLGGAQGGAMLRVRPGPKNQIICQGDSGGPLFFHTPDTGELTLAGVASRYAYNRLGELLSGDECSSVQKAYFASVRQHRGWIERSKDEFCEAFPQSQ